MGKQGTEENTTTNEDDTIVLDQDDGEQQPDTGEGTTGEADDTADASEGAGEGQDSPPEGEGTSQEEDTVTVSIGDEPPEESEEEISKAPTWVRELRKNFRDLQKEKRELEARLAQLNPEKKDPELPPKPKLDDFDFNPDRYESALAEWFEKKRAVDERARQREEAERRQQEAWKARLSEYESMKSNLKVKDYADAEAVVTEQFNQTQQGIMVQGLDNPALVVYALGKNPKKAKELAAIDDPVKFAIAVGKLETQLKVTTRKTPPAPPPKVTSGSAPMSGVIDKTLERLRAEAERTGDYTKVIQYKSSKRQK